MKLAFSTLGCPEWDLPSILKKGKEYGFDAVDFRGLGEEMMIPNASAFTDQLEATLSAVGESGLEVCCLSSSVQCVPKNKESLKDAIDELEAYVELASKLMVPYVRIFGGTGPEGADLEKRLEIGGKVLQAMGEMAGSKGVQLVLETHDEWCNTQHLKMLLDVAEHPCVGVCWDINHPFRAAGEQPETSWGNLFGTIWYVHVKDSTSDGNLCLVGDGDLPVKRFLEILAQGQYPGVYCLEWEKRWHPEIADPDEAFPQYVEKMRAWAAELDSD